MTAVSIEKIVEIARVCHEVNRAYCLALGDSSHKVWDKAHEWQRASAINGVQFLVENSSATAITAHEGWLAHKREQGWTYGPVKLDSAREHPNMVPFHELSVAEQAKDHIFVAIVRAMTRP